MIARSILSEARLALTQFRVLCITGPRQSGKTTLSRALFAGKAYVNFEDPSVQFQFQQDPSAFIERYRDGAVFDEVQRVPDVFRYLQVHVDRHTRRGQFILTGSNNYLLQQQVSQSLAGRAGYLTLLPLSFEELQEAGYPKKDVDTYLLKGGYPEIWAEQLKPQKWLESYIQTYIQRDVRQLRNISDLAAFMRLVQLCAHHAGQLLNREELAKQTGVDSKTVQSWLGLLESSYILFQLQPWHNNLNKRIIKSPKLYFYDTGLLCTLLRISSKQGLKQHPMYGAIFENWCVAELCKNRLNRGERDGLYFFRDSTGNEIDVIMEKETGPLAIEIKSSSKEDLPLTGGLRYWRKYQPGRQGILLYQKTSRKTDHPDLGLLSWTDIGEI